MIGLVKRMGFAGVLVLVAALSAATDLVANKWQGLSGGKWGVGSNWSFGRYQQSGKTSPVSITLSGNGSVTATWAAGSPAQHVERRDRNLMLDGVSLTLNEKLLLLYSRLELKNGASYTGNKEIYFWANDTVALSVGSGCSLDTNGIYVNGTDSLIEVGRGVFTGGAMRRTAYKASKSVKVSVSSGGRSSFTSLSLYFTSSLSMASGALTVGTGGLALFDDATLNLTGGSVQVAQEITLALARLVRESKGMAVATTKFLANIASADDAAVNVVEAGETLVLRGGLAAKYGPVTLRNGCTLRSDQPVLAKQFFNGTGMVEPATLWLKTVVLGESPRFTDIGSKTAAKRRLNIEGPTAIRAFADIPMIGTFITMASVEDGHALQVSCLHGCTLIFRQDRMLEGKSI